MATITVTSSLTYTDISGSEKLSGSFTLTQLGSNFSAETQLISSTTAVAIDVGAALLAGTLYCILIRNNDSTNFVEIATDSDMAKNVSKILPGQMVPVFPKTS